MTPRKSVFLSYASEDADVARDLATGLRKAGIEVWFDQTALRGGDAWDASIRSQIRACSLFVPLVSANTEARGEGYFRLEWKLAVERSHLLADDEPFLMPLVIDGTSEASARVPDRFREKQWLRLSDAASLASIVERLQRLAGDVPAPATPNSTGDARPSAPRSSGGDATSGKSRGISICVLPFVNMSGDVEQEYFSDGITEDIITDLSKVASLWVAARNTAFTFKGRNVDVQQVARQLEVSHVLEGSVRKSGGRVRITAQLIDGASGGHVWAERYDRDLNDIFALQDEISGAIVAALRIKLQPEERRAIEQRGTASPEAYKYYLMARNFRFNANAGVARTHDITIRLCQRATEIDPGYARAWALLAAGQESLRLMTARETDGGLAAAERALSLDPNLAEARAARARALMGDGLEAQALQEVELALSLDAESQDVLNAAARILFQIGRIAEATAHFERLAELSPGDYGIAIMLLTCYRVTGNAQQLKHAATIGLERAEKVVALEPDNGSAMGCIVLCLTTLGENERAREWMERGVLLDPDNMNMRYNFACILISDLHDLDAGLDLLEPLTKVFLRPSLNWIKNDPDMDRVRNHPRYIAIMGEAEERLAV